VLAEIEICGWPVAEGPLPLHLPFYWPLVLHHCLVAWLSTFPPPGNTQLLAPPTFFSSFFSASGGSILSRHIIHRLLAFLSVLMASRTDVHRTYQDAFQDVR